MQKINESLSIGTKLTMSDVQLFSIRSVDQGLYVAFDVDEDNFYLTEDIDLAEQFDGIDIINEIDEIICELEQEYEDTFSIEFIGVQSAINYGRDS